MNGKCRQRTWPNFANGVEQIQRRRKEGRKEGRGTRLKSVKQLEEREKRREKVRLSPKFFVAIYRGETIREGESKKERSRPWWKLLAAFFLYRSPWSPSSSPSSLSV